MPHPSNCICYICYICCCDCRWKKLFKNGTSAEAPSRCRPWFPLTPLLPAAARRTPRGLRVLPNAVESDLSTGGVAPGGVTGGDRWAPRGRVPGRWGRPRRRPSPRGTRPSPGGRCRLPSAALTSRIHRLGRGCRGRGAGGPGRPGGRRRTPRRRCGRLGARRNETEMTMFFSSFPLIFLISRSYKSAKSATKFHWISFWNLKLLNFEVHGVHVVVLEVQLQTTSSILLPEVASSSIFSQ